MKRKLTCFCEYEFETDLPESVDLGREPRIEEDILSGDFLSVRCPNCGKLLKPEFPVMIRDPASEWTLFFIPELERVSFYRNALPYSIGEADRVVIGYEELAEKLRIKAAGLDDRVVEVVKYYLLQQAQERAQEDQDIRILFAGLEAGGLVFHAHGIKEKQVGVLRVSRRMADTAAAQLEQKRRQEPFSLILSGPYVSVNKLLTESPE